jgi:complex iron-sulfur molybdoenzyme family reductase subunit gamma
MMKNFFKLLIIVSLAWSVNLFSASNIDSVKVLGNVSNLGPQSRAWLSAPYTDIVLYPLYTREEGNETFAKKARVKAVYDGENISFLLEWSKHSKNKIDDNSSLKLNGFSVKFPLVFNDLAKLPYIDMGDAEHGLKGYSYKLYQQSLDTNVSDENLSQNILTTQEKEVFIAKGVNAVKTINSDKAYMELLTENGKFKGTLSKKLHDADLDLSKGVFPLSFVVNEKKLKYSSPWIMVALEDKNKESNVQAFNENVEGDVPNGEKLALENCAGCHRYNTIKTAPVSMSPNLSNVGGYSTSEYLRESIIDPSAVIVSGYKNNTYSNFDWFVLDLNGKKTSIMPTFNWLDEKSINDLVAFMKTLKDNSK